MGHLQIRIQTGRFVFVRETMSVENTRKLEEGVGSVPPRPRSRETRRLATEERAVIAVPPAYLGLSREEMTWAALAHASVLLTLLLGVVSGGVIALLGPIVPALIWYTYRERSEYVVDQARQATIFQLMGILGILVLALVGAAAVTIGWAVSAALSLVLIGLLLLPLMLILSIVWAGALIALPIALAFYGIYAALEAHNGRPFRYRWIADLVDRYQDQT